jgi:hypothetical protein
MKRIHSITTGVLVAVCVMSARANAGEIELNLFTEEADWRFVKNTADGSFELVTEDNIAIGVMNYDFSRSTDARAGNYVLATGDTKIEEGAEELRIDVRSSRAQRLTFRIIDETGQTHQFKGRSTGSGDWETIKIPLNRRLEHWDGAQDGKVHFPIQRITLSVPAPADDPKSGKVEYGRAVVVTK